MFRDKCGRLGWDPIFTVVAIYAIAALLGAGVGVGFANLKQSAASQARSERSRARLSEYAASVSLIDSAQSQVEARLLSDPIAAINDLSGSGALLLVDFATVLDAMMNDANGDPFVAFTKALRVENAAMRSQLLKEIFQIASNKMPKEALGLLRLLTPEVANEVARPFFDRLIAERGAAAFHEIWSAADVPRKISSLAIVPFSRRYPTEMAEFLIRSPNSELAGASIFRYGRTTAVQAGLAFLSPEQKLEALNRLPRSRDTDDMVIRAYKDILKADPQRLSDLVARDPGVLTYAAIQMALAPDVNRPVEITNAFADALPGSRGRAEKLSDTASFLARRDPKSAIQWADSLRDPIARVSALRAATQQWYATNPKAAIEYGATKPDSQGIGDDALSSFLDSIPISDLSDASQPLGGLSSEARSKVLKAAAKLPSDRRAAIERAVGY